MRIVHTFKAYHPVVGGIENHIRWLAKEQVRQGHDVTVLTCASRRSTNIWTDDAVKVFAMARVGSPFSVPISAGIARYLSTESPDILHVHAPYPFGSAASLRSRATARVLTYHCDVTKSPVLQRMYRPVQTRILRGMDGIITTSEALRNTSLILRPFKDQVVVIPLGIPLPIETSSHRRLSEPQVGAGADIRLLYLGKLRHYKGLDVLLQAMARIPDVSLTIAGTGEMDNPWKQLATRLGLDARVTFTGHVDEAAKTELLATSDIFVLPSTTRSEAFGLAMLEAMAAGLAVVSTELETGTSWVNQHGETGLVVPPSDPDSLTEALTQLIHDPAARRQMGMAGQDRCRRFFSLEAMANSVAAFYETVLRRVS